MLGGREFPFHRRVTRVKHARVLDGTGRPDRPIGGLVSALTALEYQLARTPNTGGKLQQRRPGRDAYSLTSFRRDPARDLREPALRHGSCWRRSSASRACCTMPREAIRPRSGSDGVQHPVDASDLACCRPQPPLALVRTPQGC